LGKPRRIERDGVADVDAEHERVLARLREHLGRQSGGNRTTPGAEQLNEPAPIDPAKLLGHFIPPHDGLFIGAILE
jgi:hypothetical protein